uniref:HTH CENPB-type domain-containing protein n=1 Tax=Graphocephala atropunctata TaxID=36148 RepID=A0A1B6LLX5_9HEMI
MSHQKRKRVVPTIQQKIDMIKQLDEGVSVRELALKYNIGCTTVHDVKKNRDKLLKFSIAASDSIFGIQHRRTMKKSPYELLHKAMLQWFNCERAEGRPVTGPMCVKQAKYLFETLGMKGNFDASSGWLARFKDRHGIRTVGDSMDCLWTRSKTEKELQFNESNKVDNSQLEEHSLNGSRESLQNKSTVGLTDEATEDDKILKSSVQNENAQGAFSQLASTNRKEKDIEENVVYDQSNNDIKNYINVIDLNSVVKKLEAISEKLATSDSYDQFGTYITCLLRRLPQDKALMLKQNIVNDVLDAIIVHERGLDENSLNNTDFDNSLINETSGVKRQKHSFTFVSCNTSEASNLPVPVKKKQLGRHPKECSSSKKSLEPPTSQLLPDNISPSTGRPASHTDISQEMLRSDNPNNVHFQTNKRLKARKTRKKQQTNAIKNSVSIASDMEDCTSDREAMRAKN